MKVKSFRAESVASALKQVREEMGGEAMVLNTKRLTKNLRGNRVEITACVEHELLKKNSQTKVVTTPDTIVEAKTETKEIEPTPSLNDEHAQSIKEILKKLDALNKKVTTAFVQSNRENAIAMSPSLIGTLSDADFTQDDIAAMIGSVQNSAWSNSEVEQFSTLRELMVTKFASIMKPDMRFNPGDRIILIGPAGSGKSSVMGKLALHLVSQQGIKVKLSSLDTFKVGGHEEIASYADLLGVEMTEETTAESNISVTNDYVTLIDSPSLPIEANARNKLFNTIEHINPSHRLLVLPSTTRTADLREICESALLFCPTHFVMTMTDLTHRFGALFSAAEILKRPMAFITDAPGGIGTIKTPDPDAMVRRILKSEGALCKC